MTQVALRLNQAQVMTAIRSYLLSVLPSEVEVVAGQDNRVGEPRAADYVVMTMIGRERLSTTTVDYADVPGAGLRLSTEAVRATLQLDIHGPESEDNAQVITTLMNDDSAFVAFIALGPSLRPLYAADPIQTPFVNGENQFETRWTVDCSFQLNPVVAQDQDFADQLHVTPIRADGQ